MQSMDWLLFNRRNSTNPYADAKGTLRMVVPSQATAVTALAELVVEVQLCCRMSMLCMEASQALVPQMANSFFLPFCLTAAATMATLRVNSTSHLLQCIAVFNQLVPVAAALPYRSARAGNVRCLPESLGVQWRNGLPAVVVNHFRSTAGFFDLNMHLCAQHCVSYGACANNSHTPGVQPDSAVRCA